MKCFCCSGLPSIREIRTNIENKTNEGLKRIGIIQKINELKKEIISKTVSAEKITEKAIEKVMRLRKVLQNKTEAQLVQIQDKVEDFNSFQVSVISSMFEMLQKNPSEDYLHQLKKILENPDVLMGNVLGNFKFLEEIEPHASEKLDRLPLPIDQILDQLNFVSVPNFNDIFQQNLKKKDLHEAINEHLTNIQNADILSEIKKKTQEMPFLMDTINSTQIFLKVINY